MHPAAPFVLLAMGVAVVALLVAERRASLAGQWASKPVASAGFVALGVLTDAPPALLAAFLLAFAGDVLLIPRDARVFRAGIVAFLLAHVAFVAHFATLGVAWPRALVATPVVGAVSWLIARRILPHVARPLVGAVVAYVVVITAMVIVAAGTRWPLLVAAALFYANDVLVARNRFVEPAFVNRLVGLPMYYAAMVLFALA